MHIALLFAPSSGAAVGASPVTEHFQEAGSPGTAAPPIQAKFSLGWMEM